MYDINKEKSSVYISSLVIGYSEDYKLADETKLNISVTGIGNRDQDGNLYIDGKFDEETITCIHQSRVVSHGDKTSEMLFLEEEFTKNLLENSKDKISKYLWDLEKEKQPIDISTIKHLPIKEQVAECLLNDVESNKELLLKLIKIGLNSKGKILLDSINKYKL